MHGKGKLDFADGNQYIGDWVDDRRTGQGVYSYANGGHSRSAITRFTYQINEQVSGQRKDNKMNGQGKFDFATGEQCIGDWLDDVRTGQGELFMGLFKDNKEHGKGTFVWGPESQCSGDEYTGDWVDGRRTGQGVYISANGNRYECRYSQIIR
ncbi:unnamed protein product [Rotaria socialis]|uniref:Uncharacterized protein n=2 Tax=Rotaria socialis TaxID=392032 RepID=A0A817X7S8_9BILA|nr:unnamed protein product [Rotaria socialis]